MRKPNSNPFKPVKLHGKDFLVANQGLRSEIRRIDHPLLKGKFEGEWEIEQARQDLKWRKERFRLHVLRKQWEQCVDLLLPRERLGYLLSVRRHIDDDAEFFDLVRHVLSQNPALHAYNYSLRQLFRRMGNHTPWEQLMTEGEVEALNQLPNPMVLWQASGEGGMGWAWTPERDQAVRDARGFAERSARKQSLVFKGQVPKTAIVGFLQDTPPGHETVFANPEQIVLLGGNRVGAGT